MGRVLKGLIVGLGRGQALLRGELRKGTVY